MVQEKYKNKREVIYYEVSPFASQSAQTNVTGELQDFSDIIKLYAEEDALEFESIQTLEHNYTILDGSHYEFNVNKKQTFALWSLKQSAYPSRFLPENVILDVKFGGFQTSNGISFYFDRENNNWCDALNVKWYRDSALLSERNFEPDGAIWGGKQKVELYNRVVINFKKMSQPYRYLKIESVIFGLVKIFKDDELSELTITEKTDPTGQILPINSASFTINTPESEEYFFEKRQPIYVNYKGARMGAFYLDKATRYATKKFNVEGIDRVGVLDGMSEFLGGLYEKASAGEIIKEIINNVFSVEFFDETYDEIISGWLPIMKRREALAQVCFAIGAICDCTRTGKIKIRKLKNVITESVEKSRVYASSSVDVEFPFTGIELIEYNFVAGTEIKELFKEAFSGTKTVNFSQPTDSLTITGGTILKISVNFAEISSNGATECILKGKPRLISESSVKINNSLIIEGTQEHIQKVEKFYLVNSQNSHKLANNLYKYYLKQNAFNGDFLLNNNLRNLEKIGDKIKIKTVFNEDITGIIEGLTLNLGYENIKARGLIRDN